MGGMADDDLVVALIAISRGEACWGKGTPVGIAHEALSRAAMQRPSKAHMLKRAREENPMLRLTVQDNLAALSRLAGSPRSKKPSALSIKAWLLERATDPRWLVIVLWACTGLYIIDGVGEWL